MTPTATDTPTETTDNGAAGSLTAKVTELLNQEKWTRAALNSYVTSNFVELDNLLEDARKEECEAELMELCDEHLRSNRNSIIALYLSGIVSIGRRLVDDSNLVLLVNIFTDNHKWNIVEYLCNRILEFGENRFALRTLAESYDNKNEEASKLEVYERLIRVDYEEADFVKVLARNREQAGDVSGAVNYYRKALHRYINKRNYANIKEVWDRLIEHQPDDTEFYLQLERKVARTVSEERAVALLESLYPHHYEKEDWDTTIEILKRILRYEPKNAEARAQIAEAYTEKHAGHSHLDEYLRISNLTQAWRNAQEAIADFEKHIAFDTGNFVFHRSWGIGRISAIDDDEITIDFPKKRNHRMSLKMAVSALKILARDHFWVQKATTSRTRLRDGVKGDPAATLRSIIRSFGNQADMKRIKMELVPRILTASEWSKWSTAARRILKEGEEFGSHEEKPDTYVVRDTPMSYAEKTFSKFTAERVFLNRVKILQEYLQKIEEDQKDGTDTSLDGSEYLGEMVAYFGGFLKTYTAGNDQVIASFLLVQRIGKKHPYLATGVDMVFADLLAHVDDLDGLFLALDNNELRKDFLMHVREEVAEWPAVYSRFFYLKPSRLLVDELIHHNEFGSLERIAAKVFESYRDLREPFVWLLRNCEDEAWFTGVASRQEKCLTALVHLLDLTYRDIENRRDVSAGRRLNKQIHDYLFKDGNLLRFTLLADLETITRIHSMVADIEHLDPSIKIRLKEKITDRFPEFESVGEPLAVERTRAGLLVTRGGYEAKQRDLRHLIEVEIPVNSKEIGVAMQKGDLRENAEYKAALEKQELLKSSASRLQEELQEAQIFDSNQVDDQTVSFGTTVHLTNVATGDNEHFTILGPWESDPARNVISYLSPLGAELWSHRPEDVLQFTINEKPFHYRVESIERAEALR
ncbi:MAG: transcription elongation factor GreA [Spirochaetaceae bacterium]|nr:transcription elongation factor GreA [Spirochaetaceae bacterium]